MVKRLVLLFVCFCTLVLAGDEKRLAPEAFLAAIREPLSRDVWGEITGRITHVADGRKKLTGDLRVRVTFSNGALHSQIVLDDKNVYGFEQKHQPGAGVRTKLSKPDPEIAPGLFEFGLEPEDLTFSFLYWNFIEELPPQKSRMRSCRVMKLEHPENKGIVQAWFDEELGFPLEIHWIRKGETEAWRTLEMKGAKRHENGLWFVREMRLDGKGWKTRVQFDFASIQEIK